MGWKAKAATMNPPVVHRSAGDWHGDTHGHGSNLCGDRGRACVHMSCFSCLPSTRAIEQQSYVVSSINPTINKYVLSPYCAVW